MKQLILSIFHYVLFFWGVFLMTTPKTSLYDKALECDHVATEQTQQVAAAGANTELLNCGFLFKF